MRLTLLTPLLLLSACSSVRLPTDVTPATSVTGQVASAPLPDTLTYAPASGDPPVTATVKPDGTFTLPLPEPATLTNPTTFMGVSGCTGDVKASSDVQGAAAFHLSSAERSYYAGETRTSAVPPRAQVVLQGFIYTSGPTVLTGTLDCASILKVTTTLPVTLNVTTAKGWNRVNLALTVNATLSGLQGDGRLTSGGDKLTTWRSSQDLAASMKIF